MHKVSRTLLLAGVLAFGTLSAACGDKVEITQPVVVPGVTGITVSPPTATVQQGQSIQLSAVVTADAATAKTVTWASSNTAVATVDATGKVTGVTGGTVTITATSTADASKAAGSAVTVIGTTPAQVPTISIATVTDVNGNPVQLGNVNGQVNVTVNTSGGGTVDIFVAPAANCASAVIAANDVKVATQVTTSPQAGAITLSFNTAALTAANAPQFPNGNYCIKARLISGTQTVSAANTTPITLNNVNQFKSTVAFTSQTGGPTSGVSTINGFNYNQGTMTATINPVVFTSASPVALISGYLTHNGEQAGAAVSTQIGFSGIAVTSGVATVTFTDTSATGVRSIFAYTSSTLGDTLVITSATDAAGNPVQTTAAVAVSGVRIDNDAPATAGASFAVVPGVNGYVGANYIFANGTTSPSSIVDTKALISGSGGVTSIYYVGTAGSTAFATAGSCNTTGLTAVTTGSDLANSVSNTNYAAKVVNSDKLGNKICADIVTLFGVDKIAPTLAFASTSAADQTGYTSRLKTFDFIFSDTISGFNPAAPLQVLLVRNGFATGVAAECVIGTYTLATKTCTKAPSTGSFSIGDALSTNGYYTVTANSIDQAAPGNTSPSLTRTVALDSIAPIVSAAGQSPAAVIIAGPVTVTGSATDNLNLSSARANLFYAIPAATFARVSQTLGAFGANVTSSALAVALPGPVYTGLQNASGGTVLAGGVAPQDTLTAVDVGGNTNTSTGAIVTAATKADTLVGFAMNLSSSVAAAPATTQASTNLSVVLTGTTTNLPNQPFVSVDFYKVTSGRLVLVGSQGLGAVTDTPASVRTWTFTLNAPLAAGTSTGPTANQFYAVARNSSGNGILTNSVTVTNP